MDINQILAESEFSVWQQWAERITSNNPVRVVKHPETCLIMLKALDSVGNEPFCLGEALMTEAAVEINGITGYGFVLDSEPQKALCFAVIDAAITADLPEKAELERELMHQAEKMKQELMHQLAIINRSKVDFSIMEG